MNSPTPAAAGAADRRRAHRRVGACAGAAFLALLLLGALRAPDGGRAGAPDGGGAGAPGGGGSAPAPSTGGASST